MNVPLFGTQAFSDVVILIGRYFDNQNNCRRGKSQTSRILRQRSSCRGIDSAIQRL
jgi:hypothetical protein